MNQFTPVHKMLDAYEMALSQFPPSSVNNSRAIVKEKLERMSKNPNDRTAKELDNLGFSVDHDDRDHMGEWLESDFSKENHD